MQQLYPYFAIYRGPRKSEELLKYIYSHAQALAEIQDINERLKKEVGDMVINTSKNIEEASRIANNIVSHIDTFLKKGRQYE